MPTLQLAVKELRVDFGLLFVFEQEPIVSINRRQNAQHAAFDALVDNQLVLNWEQNVGVDADDKRTCCDAAQSSLEAIAATANIVRIECFR